MVYCLVVKLCKIKHFYLIIQIYLHQIFEYGRIKTSISIKYLFISLYCKNNSIPCIVLWNFWTF